MTGGWRRRPGRERWGWAEGPDGKPTKKRIVAIRPGGW
jgi:hypothetical protein